MSQTTPVMDMKKRIKVALWKRNRCSALYSLQCVGERKTWFAATTSTEISSILYSKYFISRTWPSIWNPESELQDVQWKLFWGF